MVVKISKKFFIVIFTILFLLASITVSSNLNGINTKIGNTLIMQNFTTNTMISSANILSINTEHNAISNTTNSNKNENTLNITNTYNLANQIMTKNITIAEVGLPSNISWDIILNNIKIYSNQSIIQINIKNNTNVIFQNITVENSTYTPNLSYLKLNINTSQSLYKIVYTSILKLSNSTYNATIQKNMSIKNITQPNLTNNRVYSNKNLTLNYSLNNRSYNNSFMVNKNSNTNMISILKKYGVYNGTFIYNVSNNQSNKILSTSLVLKSKLHFKYYLNNSNNSILNNTPILNYSKINSMRPINNKNISMFINYLNSNISIIKNFQHVNISYGNILENGSFISAGKNLNFIEYNSNKTFIFYNVSIKKAIPNVSITLDGASLSKPNTTQIVYTPILPGQKNYNVSFNLKSFLNSQNYLKYTYIISFGNGTNITNSYNSSGINKQFKYNVPVNENVSIRFDVLGNNNFSSVDPTLIVYPVNIKYYVPITINNYQLSPTPAPFQEMLSVNSLNYSSYEAGNLNNIEFFYLNGTIVPSWMEGSNNTLMNNPINASNLYKSTNTIYWLNLTRGITASSGITIYMGFSSLNVNLMNSLDVGEAPQISQSFGSYDDGSSVFSFYDVNPTSTSGWSIHGSAGQKSTAPSGSHYLTTNALYVNSANGDYMYIPVSALSENSIISFDIYTTGLGDLFFLTNSGGSGQIARLDGRGGADYSGLAKATSWTSWFAPSSGLDSSKNIWYKYDILISGGTANAYIGNEYDSISTLGTLATSGFSIVDNGNYLGLIGDGLGSTYVTYWNGMVIRKYPPNGVMPTALFGAIESSNSPILLINKNPLTYGTNDIINATGSNSGDSIELFRNITLIAGPSSNPIVYNVCGSAPYINSCFPVGKYKMSVNDITSNLNASELLSVVKATPYLSIQTQNVIIYNGSYIPIKYSSLTIGNQLQSMFSVNGAVVSNTYSNNTYDFYPNGTGIYNLSIYTSGNGNYLSNRVTRNVCVTTGPSVAPSNIFFYAPICIVNNQTLAANGPFQELIKINESEYKNYLTYNSNFANFEIFNAAGNVVPSWIEQNATGNLTIWSKISNGIVSNSIYPLYIGFSSNVINLLSKSGVNGIGEFPTATSTYAQYDDGSSVFNNYFSGGSLSNWTAVGTSGQTSSAPSGSPFGTDAYYANGANGDYLYTIANNQTENSIIEYYTYTQNLDDLFFMAAQNGNGQIARVGNGGGWYGIASASAWTLWTAPPDTGTWSNEWLLIGIKILNGNAQMFLTTNPGDYNSEINRNASNSYTVADNGNYLGFVGDAAGSSTTQYMNGLIIRSYPPNGVMPYYIDGNVTKVSSQLTCTISLSPNVINFGSMNPSSSTQTTNAITDINTGNAAADLYVFGGNWINNTESFGISNTSYSTSFGTPFLLSNKLSNTATNTLVIVTPGGSNTIYFGLNIPSGVKSGNYVQTITIENSC